MGSGSCGLLGTKNASNEHRREFESWTWLYSSRTSVLLLLVKSIKPRIYKKWWDKLIEREWWTRIWKKRENFPFNINYVGKIKLMNQSCVVMPLLWSGVLFIFHHSLFVFAVLEVEDFSGWNSTLLVSGFGWFISPGKAKAEISLLIFEKWCSWAQTTHAVGSSQQRWINQELDEWIIK